MGTYQHIVSVRVGAVGEAARLFVVKVCPAGTVDTVGVAAVGVVWGKVGGSTTDVWPEELGGPILEFSAKFGNLLAETSILVLEFPDTVHGTHFVVGEAHGCLEPSDRLFELAGDSGYQDGCK